MYSEIKKNLEESNKGYSRLYNHIQNKNDNFAIIGANDRDTGKSRFNELSQLVGKLIIKGHNEEPPRNMGYNIVKGTYKHFDEPTKIDKETSLVIFGLTKEEALDIARKINQESITWKDDNYFGLISCDTGEPLIDDETGKEMRFSKMRLSNKDKDDQYGTQYKKDKHTSIGVVFEGEINSTNAVGDIIFTDNFILEMEE